MGNLPYSMFDFATSKRSNLFSSNVLQAVFMYVNKYLYYIRDMNQDISGNTIIHVLGDIRAHKRN